ncbi:MAG: GAP family protein [Candidatus Woesearchaeota archaeon]|nr:MAG: GAP family protein [Candidatus Woesearchaeota archaeon]
MAVEAGIPLLSVVVVSAAIDSINPCAIGVLILMMSVVLGARHSVKRMLFLGSIYVLSVFTVYFLAGLGLLYFLSNIPLYLTEYLSIIVGLIIIFAGIFEIKDFFWYGRGFSLHIPGYFVKKLHKYAKNTTVPAVILLGAFVSVVELPCTGAPYLAVITLLSQYFDAQAFMMLVLYNIIFVAPLLIILLLVAGGKKLYEVKKWKQESRGIIRLFIGLVLVAMGWLLILIANGTINFG